MLLTTATVGAQQKAVYLDETKPIEERVEDALARMTLDEKIAVIHAQSKFSSPGVKRLGLPDFWTDDGPHGVRPDVLWDQWEQAGQTNDSCVAFPALTCLAATWNPQMARLYGVSLGEEARYRGKDMILGPGVNINRTPLNGRNFESYARGYVGDTIQSFNGVTVGRSIAEKRSAEELRAEAVEKARKADVVIVFGGLNKSNYQDCESHDRKSYELPYGQNELVEALAAVNKNVIFVNISGNAVALPWKDKVAAIIQGWYIGSEAGNALADVITGKVNPSGKLPFTWYTRLEDCAAHALNTYPGEWHDGMLEEEYKEGVYVGYRWTDKQKKRPTYAFGYGMSYTTFKISDVKADSKTIADDKPITVTATVTNTDKVAGAETVQLYIHDVKSSIDRPVKELKGFQKVFLEPGESKTVSITVDVNALKFYDESISDWRAEKGDFEALVGNASDNITAKVKFSY